MKKLKSVAMATLLLATCFSTEATAGLDFLPILGNANADIEVTQNMQMENAVEYLYKAGDQTATVTGRMPDAFVNGDIRYVSGTGGIVDRFGTDDTKFWMGIYAGYNLGASLFKFNAPVTDASALKTLTMKISFRNSHYGSTLKEDEFIRIYAVNYNEETKKCEPIADKYINIYSEGEVTLDFLDILQLADENGRIEYLQLEAKRYSNTSVEVYNYIEFSEIRYESFNQNEKGIALKRVANGTAVCETGNSATVGSNVTVNFTPDDQYEVQGLSIQDMLGNDVEYSLSSDGLTCTFVMPNDNVIISFEFFSKYKGTIFSGGVDEVTFSYPQYYASPNASAAVMYLQSNQFFYTQSNGSFFQLKGYTGHLYGAVNFEFSKRIPNASKLSKIEMEILVNINHPYGYDDMIYIESSVPYFRLHAVEDDGTVNASKYFCFSDRNVSAQGQWVTVTLTEKDIMKLANSKDEIGTLQWSVFTDATTGSGVSEFSIRKISYEYKGE